MPQDLAGRVVLVTGGSRGIGFETAVEAARRGAAVAVGYRAQHERARAVVEQIHADGGNADAFAADLGDGAAARGLVEQVQRQLGPVDGLVNCAAVMSDGGFLQTSDDEWERVITLNLQSVVFMCRAALPHMCERGSGAIVNLSSRLAAVAAPDAAAYAAAKAAVVSLTRSLAAEFGPEGVRVNAVSPGTTNTEMGRAVLQSPTGQERIGRIPLRRFVEPAEVARAIVFLLSDAAAGMSGQTLQVNGGELMT